MKGKDKGKLKVNPSDLAVRQLKEEDLNFVWSTWLKSYRNSDFANAIPNDVYFAYHQTLINQIMLNPSNSVTVVVDPEDPDQILAYSIYCTTQPVVHFIYVKYPFRKLGLGRYLFEGIKHHYKKLLNEEDPQIFCTHRARRWARLAKGLNLAYNPYITGETLSEAPEEDKTGTV